MKNAILTAIVGITVAIIVLATLVPTINENASGLGKSVTMTNDSENAYELSEVKGNCTITIQKNPDESFMDVIVNDTTNTLGAVANTPIIVSDNFVCNSNNGGTVVNCFINGTTITGNFTNPMTITFEDGTVTIDGSTDATTTSTYLYAIDNSNGKLSSVSVADTYTKNIGDVNAGGNATVGETAITWVLHNGKITVPEGYTAELEVASETTEGTNDIKQISTLIANITDGTDTATVNIGRCVVPTEVSGHSDDGAYSLAIMIPLFLIIAILVMAVGMIARRNGD